MSLHVSQVLNVELRVLFAQLEFRVLVPFSSLHTPIPPIGMEMFTLCPFILHIGNLLPIFSGAQSQ